MSIFHNHFCPAWMAGFLDNPLRVRWQKPDVILSGLVAEGQTALDLGCGPGVFTQALARLVGTAGQVVAVDVQQAMLERARVRLKRAGLEERARFVKCGTDRIGLEDFSGRADFILAFWMVHEVPDPARFLAEVYTYLKPGGRLLLVEPSLVLPDRQFQLEDAFAKGLGLAAITHPRIPMSSAALYQKT